MSNPFPGLRPFQLEESHLFFGREEQTGQLLERLGNTRFLAVVGASGSGKSSLVRAGLLPQLYGGTMVKTSVHWEIAIMRPGGDPITNLARCLVEADIYEDNSEDQVQLLRTMLSRSGLGLLEAYRQSDIEPGSNLLILVDQFEEIFRFRQGGSKASEEAADFIELILEASWQEELPIYVILTMRSDFLGDCAEFKNLAEAVNEGEYLIPRLNRRQRAHAIEGPAKVGGGQMSPRLVQQLLNDIGDDPDQLPILQHSLMRTWEYWEDHSIDKTKPLDVEHYRAIGTMKEALSRHADEAYNQLPDDHHRKICERMFKSITERGNDGRGIRRPLPFSDLVEIVGGDEQALMKVIDDFRTTNRSFIMPLEHTKIHIDTVIDISHESLMRVWERLRGWVDEESQSARIYRRLAETSALHSTGEAGLYHDPDLRIAITWREEHHPNERWACRYSGDFHAAMKFLDDSQTQKEADEKAKEEARKRELEQAKALAKAEKDRAEIQRKSAKRNKVFAVFLFALAVLAGVMAFQANEAKKVAKNALSEAQMVESELYIDKNEPHNAMALLQKASGDNKEYEALIKRNLTIADTQPLPEFQETIVKDPDSLILQNGRGAIFSSNNRLMVALRKKKGNSGFRLYDLKAKKLLFESERYQTCESAKFSPNDELIIISAEKLDGENCVVIYDSKTGKLIKELSHKNKFIYADVSNNNDLIAGGTNKGEAIIWKAPMFEKQILTKTKGEILEIKIHPKAEKVAAVSFNNGNDYDFLFFDLSQKPVKPIEIYSSPNNQQRWWVESHYSKSGNNLIINGGGDQVGSVVVFNGNNGQQKWINESAHSKVVFDCDFSADETLLATASYDNSARIWDVESGKEHTSPLISNAGFWFCRFTFDQMKLITADYNSNCQVWNINDGTLLQNTFKQESPILAVAATDDPNKVIVTLLNGRVTLWDISRNNRLPILLTHKLQIMTSQLLPNDHIATSGLDGKVKVWDLKNLGGYHTLQVEEDVWWMDYSASSKRLFGIMCNGWVNAKGVMVWNWPDLSVHKKYLLPEGSSRVGIHPDGDIIAYSNGDDFSIQLYDLSKDQNIQKLTHHADLITHINFSPDGSKMITASFDETSKIYDMSDLEKEPINIDFGFSWGGRIEFSDDSKIFALRTTIGADSTTAKIFDTKKGSEIAVLKHESPVRSVFFSKNNEKAYTCSRSGELKAWNLKKSGELIMSAKQTLPISAVHLVPGNENLLITIDRETDSRIWDVELGKVIDGPFRGAPGQDDWYVKLHSSMSMNGFVGYYGPDALAYWPNPVSFGTKQKLSNDIFEFTGMHLGGRLDVNDSYERLNIEGGDFEKKKSEFISSSDSFNIWKEWFLSESKSSVNSPNQGLSKADYIEFLKRQNSKISIEMALLLDSSDPQTLKLYSEILLKRSQAVELNDQERSTLQKRAKWYLDRAASFN